MQEDQTDVRRLRFVFDANSGVLSALVDSTKKVLRLNGCSLCEITHGLTGEKSEWGECKVQLGLPVEYVHRDEMEPALRQLVGDQLPCVVAESSRGQEILLGPAVLERCKGSVSDFQGRLRHHAAMKGLALE